MGKKKANWNILDELYDEIESRKGGNPDKSHTARLFSRGIDKIAQKLGEEAVETVIEAVKGDKKALVSESADLFYHLLVLWAERKVDPSDVVEELARRRGISGIEEKMSRKK